MPNNTTYQYIKNAIWYRRVRRYFLKIWWNETNLIVLVSLHWIDLWDFLIIHHSFAWVLMSKKEWVNRRFAMCTCEERSLVDDYCIMSASFIFIKIIISFTIHSRTTMLLLQTSLVLFAALVLVQNAPNYRYESENSLLQKIIERSRH